MFYLCMHGEAIILVGQYPAAGVLDDFRDDVATRAGDRVSCSSEVALCEGMNKGRSRVKNGLACQSHVGVVGEVENFLGLVM